MGPRPLWCAPAAVLAALLVLAPGCAGRRGPELLPGAQAGQDLAELVDSEPARRLLQELLERRRGPERGTLVAGLPGGHLPAAPDRHAAPDQALLRELAEDVSLDFAALTFARAIGNDPESRAVQGAFERALAEGVEASEDALRAPGAFPYTVLFAPSWMYRRHPWTGADFAQQRALLDRLGIPNRLVPTAESGAVEDNAATIAAAVREAGREGERVVLVSASKSGAEVALALARLLAPAEAATVAAWVNIVGALHGSPLADLALRPPTSWLARLVFWASGWDWAGLTSMATGPSRARLEGARIPEAVLVVNVVAVPVSGSVGLKVRGGYQVLRAYGPNDGVVLLADTVWPGGVNLVALGADHLYAPGRHDAHSLALLRAVLSVLRGPLGGR